MRQSVLSVTPQPPSRGPLRVNYRLDKGVELGVKEPLSKTLRRAPLGSPDPYPLDCCRVPVRLEPVDPAERAWPERTVVVLNHHELLQSLEQPHTAIAFQSQLPLLRGWSVEWKVST